MKKCSKCQCANDDEAKYCRKCGFEFTSMPWWKQIGFIPVRNFKIKNSLTFQILSVLWLPYLVILAASIGKYSYFLFNYNNDILTELLNQYDRINTFLIEDKDGEIIIYNRKFAKKKSPKAIFEI